MNGQEGDAAGGLPDIPRRFLAAACWLWPGSTSNRQPGTAISSAETEGISYGR
jgi:hypothetical protein